MSRKEFVEELKLREMIQSIVQESLRETISKKRQDIIQENQLRKEIRNLLKELKEDEDIPESYTGINVLRDLLKKIIPVIETDYKSLTTSKEQRVSFRTHILQAVKTTLDMGNGGVAQSADTEKKEAKVELTKEQEEEDNKINVSIGKEPQEKEEKKDIKPDKEDSGKFIDITKSTKPADMFTIEGEDLTGRNMSSRCYEKIEKNIIDSYNLLDDVKDKQLFSDYLITNLKLYFDKFEGELSSVVEEPTTSQYEKEKEIQSQDKKEQEKTALTAKTPEEISV